MKTYSVKFSANAMTLAVQGALIAMCAAPLGALAQGAENEEFVALTRPTNFVEIGVGNTSTKSQKFGEYNGLEKKGGELVGDFSVKGGDAYGAGTGARRWGVSGTDLGTTSRAIDGTIGDQGSWNFGVGYDELRHNTGTGFQTHFQGSMGGNNFTLPATFGVINTSAPAFPGSAGSLNMTPNQQASLQNQDVHSDRKKTSFNAGYVFNPNWNMTMDFNHLKQSGAKLLGVAGDQANGINLQWALQVWAGQTPLVIMNPTNYTTDNLNLAANWVGEKGHASISYAGSVFRDNYNSVSFNNPFVKTVTLGNAPNGSIPPAGFATDTMSTMPSNQFHQLNLKGGYAFNSATKLAGGLSYSRNTQNDAYAATGLTPVGVPVGSLNGVVVSKHLDVKLTNQTTRDLALSAGLKFNERDNKTASNAYSFNNINEAAITAPNVAVNAPMSNKKTQVEFGGDYRIDKQQKLNLAYEYEKINRWCNNAAANTTVGLFLPTYSGVAAYVPTTCAEVQSSKENKLSANYKYKVASDLSFNAGYGYARRKSDITPTYYNPMQSDKEGYNAPGFMAFFQASRKEQLFKAGANWQANEKLSISVNGRYTDDKYDDLTYGVQKGNKWSLNLDATYNLEENRSVSAYVTNQYSSRDMTNVYTPAAGAGTVASATALGVPAGLNTWTNKLKENDITLGIGTKQGGLMGGKLEIAGDLTYSVGKTDIGQQFSYLSVNSNGIPCSSSFYLTCGDVPTINNKMLQLKLTGSYKLDQASKIVMGYSYQRLSSSDYMYNALQLGYTPSTQLPSNEQAPSYSVNRLFAAYNFSFK